MPATKTHLLVIPNIDIPQVLKKYNVNISTNHEINKDNILYQEDISSTSAAENDSNNYTKLEDIGFIPEDKHSTSSTVSFMDEMKHTIFCKISQVDYTTENNIADTNNIDCFWCRHSFQNQPIGCPIKYVPHKVNKTYHSEISKDKYTICEKIPDYKLETVKQIISQKNNNATYNVDKGGYFITDGVFCSFNCCKAYIEDNSHNPLYDSSSKLLVKMYNMIYQNENITSIIKASHWRLLKNRGGGFLDIEKFRENFNRVSYDYKGIIYNICKPVTHTWQERINL